MREVPTIPEKDLRACLQKQYDLSSVSLEFLALGLDYNAGVYRMESKGTPYLLKVKSGALYEPGCIVPRYLRDQGIASVVAPVPTKNNTLWVRLEDWTVIVYPFLDGDTSWTGMTDEQWRMVGTTFKQVHQVTLPSSGFESLRKETFDPGEYVRWVRDFEAQHLHSRVGGGASERTLLSSWRENQSKIHTVVASLEKLAGELQSRSLPYVIAHADLHPANLLRDHEGHVYVIDWDEVMLAPKERDFIYVRQPHADAFFAGYGQTDIDWVALTYYLWERVVQDLIVCAESVCFRDDWGEESKADATQLFHDILTGEESDIKAAFAAATHLSPDLTVD